VHTWRSNRHICSATGNNQRRRRLPRSAACCRATVPRSLWHASAGARGDCHPSPTRSFWTASLGLGSPAKSMGAGPSAGGLPGGAPAVVWRDDMLADTAEDERAAAARKKARKEARAKRRVAEEGCASGSFAAQRSKDEILAKRHERVAPSLPLAEVTSPDSRRRSRSDSSGRRHERRRDSKVKKQGKENLPVVSTSPNRAHHKKDGRRPSTTPIKHRTKKRPEELDELPRTWKNTSMSRYKDPQMWRLENRPTFGEFKKAHGWNEEQPLSGRRTATGVGRRHSASTPPRSLLLSGDRALAVKVGKSVAFSDVGNETQTFEAAGAMRRRRSAR
jgi:hypothetical protein